MNRLSSRLAAVAALTLFAASAYGAEETRNVPAFSSIAYGGSAMIDVTVGKPQTLVLSGDAELLRHITTTVEDGELKIRTENGYHWNNSERLAVRISMPRLAALSSAGSASTTINGFKGGDTEFRISGSGDVTATGEIDKLSLKVSGSGSAHLEKLNTQAATVTISGSGDVVVQPKRTLVATVNGSGDLRYIGSPQVTSEVHGSGTIRHQ